MTFQITLAPRLPLLYMCRYELAQSSRHPSVSSQLQTYARAQMKPKKRQNAKKQTKISMSRDNFPSKGRICECHPSPLQSPLPWLVVNPKLAAPPFGKVCQFHIDVPSKVVMLFATDDDASSATRLAKRIIWDGTAGECACECRIRMKCE